MTTVASTAQPPSLWLRYHMSTVASTAQHTRLPCGCVTTCQQSPAQHSTPAFLVAALPHVNSRQHSTAHPPSLWLRYHMSTVASTAQHTRLPCGSVTTCQQSPAQHITPAFLVAALPHVNSRQHSTAQHTRLPCGCVTTC